MVIHILKQIGGDTIPKHKPPSRIRYEKSHPTVSFRLTRELKERLEKVLEEKSFADFVKEGLGVREREKKSLKEARDDGYADGHNDAYNRACELFAVYTRCGICGERMIVKSSEMKKALHEYIQSQGWGHYTCMVERKEGEAREREKREAGERERRRIKREIEREADRLLRRRRR